MNIEDKIIYNIIVKELLKKQKQEIINEIAQYSGINDIQTKELIKIIK